MRLLRKLGIPTQLRLTVVLATLFALMVVGSGGYVLSLYEHFRSHFAQAEVPLLTEILELNESVTAIQQELGVLVERAKSGAVDKQTLHREGERLVERFDASMARFPTTVHLDEKDILERDLQEMQASMARYRGDLIATVDTLAVDPDLAGQAWKRLASDGVRVNRESAQSLKKFGAHLVRESGDLSTELRRVALPVLIVLMLLMGVLYWFLNRIARDVGSSVSWIHGTLERLRVGDTETPVLSPTESVEARQVAHALEAFRSTLIELAQMRGELEDKVVERTRLLGETNDKLSRQLTQLNAAERELRLFKRAFHSASEAIVITDLSGIIIEVNKAYEVITGYARDEVIGCNPSMAASGRHDKAFYQQMWALILQHGSWTGEIWDRRRNGEEYVKLLGISTVYDEDQNRTHYVGVFTDISEIKETEAQLERMAYYDRLTGLPNRRLLLDRVEHAVALAKRNHTRGGVIFLDLDKFKSINDTLGHNAGDALLIEAARRIRGCVRESDTVGRLGGDEFLVLIESLSDVEELAAWQARVLGEKIVSRLADPFPLGENVVHAGGSAGIALFDELTHMRVDELVSNADTAMYEAKKAGRGTVRFFDPLMQETLQARVALEDLVREALKDNRFDLHLQPQFDDTRRIVGVEALIRLLDDDGLAVAPSSFIPVAEESMLIQHIGRWVMNEACSVLTRWADDPVLATIPIAINVSAKQFNAPHFVEETREIIGRHAIQPGLLKIELTESIVVTNIEEAISRMQALRSMGIRLAMDDFGTGYSSLSYLRRLPFDQIKIDRTFVSSMMENQSDAFIVHSVQTMARLLEAELVAEGVETAEQLDALLALGISLFQGYLLARPMPIDACVEFIRDTQVPTGRHVA